MAFSEKNKTERKTGKNLIDLQMICFMTVNCIMIISGFERIYLLSGLTGVFA